MYEENKPKESALLATATLAGGSRGAAARQALGGALLAGRYELLRQVGRGGMGSVYQARDTLVGDVVALKVLELSANSEALERFRREVRLARRISHPNVARTFDLGESAGQAFLTMEYVEGEDLQALLARERGLTPVRAARMVMAVCEGLAAAHAAGVVHRDLKPANVLLEHTGRVVLTDFGIARALAEEAAARTLGTVGTPLYMAPEQLVEEPVGPATDVYAAGLLLYELLVGAPAFSGNTALAAALARLRQPAPDPRARAEVPAALAELVLQCLAREPLARPAGALEVARALRAWLSPGEPPAALQPPAAEPAPAAARLAQPPQPQPSGSPPLRPATLPPGRLLSLAVLPLRFHGPSQWEYLGEALADSLTDWLGRTRGLQALARGAVERFRAESDPRVLGQQLGVELLVEGRVHCHGSRLLASVRLVEVGSGVQVWSGRCEESPVEEPEAQERLTQRLAESLRRELLLVAHRHQASNEALHLCRQAFAQVFASNLSDPGEVVRRLEECLALSPGFQPALALHANATLRLSYYNLKVPKRDWRVVAQESVERAQRLAPELAETQLAGAVLCSQRGEWRGAVGALRAVLAAVPTFAVAMQHLGSLQCEAGRAEEGLPLLRLASELEPQYLLATYDIARCSALYGQLEGYRHALAKIMTVPGFRLPALLLRLRVAAWYGETEEVRRIQREMQDEPSELAPYGLGYAAAVLGEADPATAFQPYGEAVARPIGSRFASVLCQLAAEGLCLVGQPAQALEYFQRAASTSLIDLEWTDRCPALEPLRALAGFAEGRRQVRARVEAIWNT